MIIFLNIGPTLAKSIPRINKSPLSYLGNRLAESTYLAPVNENEIGQLIKPLKDTAAWFDDLNSMCLKYPLIFLQSHWPTFASCLFLRWFFSEQLKIANVIPLYKSDDSMLLNNYRPVSILCVLSNIFKRSCIIGLQLSLKYFKFYMVINMDLGRSHQLMRHYWLL